MSTLFTISESWYAKPALYEQLAFASQGDALLLLQDGVLAMQSPVSLASFLAKCDRVGIAVFALAEDVKIRGIDNQYPSINLVDYDGFVELAVTHAKNVAW